MPCRHGAAFRRAFWFFAEQADVGGRGGADADRINALTFLQCADIDAIGQSVSGPISPRSFSPTDFGHHTLPYGGDAVRNGVSASMWFCMQCVWGRLDASSGDEALMGKAGTASGVC